MPTQVVPPVIPDLSLPVPLPVPVPDADVVNGLFSYPEALMSDIARFAFPTGQGIPGVAPPCRQQPPFDVDGEVTQYPRIKAAGPAE